MCIHLFVQLTGALLDDPGAVDNKATHEVDEIFKAIENLIKTSPTLGRSVETSIIIIISKIVILMMII